MSNEKQDLINHRLTATACKNYTDKEIKKAKDELKTFFSKNTVNTEDHTNELSYQITAPSGAKLLQLQSIGGNSVKYEPSVASDDTTALIKTMPSVVYDFDVNKVKGVSEVSENLIVFNDKVETTTNGVKVKYQDGAVYLDGTANAQFKVVVQFKQPIYANKDYYVKLFTSGTTTATNPKAIGETSTDERLLISSTTTFNVAYNINYFWFSVGANSVWTSYVVKPMIVKGTTEPKEFKVGYEGIHNNELTGFKVEGANLVNIENKTITSQGYLFNTSVNNLKNNTTYTCSFNWSGGGSLQFRALKNNNNVGSNTINDVSSGRNSITITTTDVPDTIYLYSNNSSGGTASNVTVNRDSSDLGYVPYIAPTTIPINLTSIVDSSGNKLFEDGSLKGINDVYDEITPFKAIKKVDSLVLSQYNWTRNGTYWYIIINKEIQNFIVDSNILTKGTISEALANTNVIASADTRFLIGDPDSIYETSNDLVNAISGDTVIYEFATPIEADIDLSQLKSIQGHSNGSITAQNTYDMAVPSEIRYNSIIQDTLCPSVSVEGSNMWDEYFEVGSIDVANGQNITATATCRGANYTKVNPNSTYKLNYVYRVFYYDTNKNYLGYSGIADTTGAGGTINTPDKCEYIRFNFVSEYGTTYKNNIRLNRGSSLLPYYPYKPSITRNLPTQTSDGYGVNANVHNLRVFSDYEGNEVNKRYNNVNKDDMGDYNWTYNNVYNRFYAKIQDFPQVPQRTIDLLANNYTAKTNSEGINVNWDMVIYNGNLDNGVYIHDHRYNDATIFKTAKSGEPMYYPLADTSKTETDLDSFDYFFDVEEGDTITFNNPYAQQVYATYSFIIKEVKSNE